MTSPSTRPQAGDRLAQLMTRALATVDTATPLDRVAEILADNDIGAVVVLDDHGLVGLVSERDLVVHLGGGADLAHLAAGEVMTTDMLVASPGDGAIATAVRMRDAGIRHLPVLEDRVVVGMVSLRDLLSPLLTAVEQASPRQRGGA